MSIVKREARVRCCLIRHSDDLGEIVDVEPTMKKIVRGGEAFHRTTSSQICDDGKWAAIYLTEHYGKRLIEKLKAEGKWKE